MWRAHLASTRDDGNVRDQRPPKPCCTRLERGAWCALPAGHEGRCLGFETPSKEPTKQ